MSQVEDTLDDLALLISRAGETCKKLPDALKERHPNLPWREMATFRNFASHDYFGVDAKLVWGAAMSLEPIKAMMREEVIRLEAERRQTERDKDNGRER